MPWLTTNLRPFQTNILKNNARPPSSIILDNLYQSQTIIHSCLRGGVIIKLAHPEHELRSSCIYFILFSSYKIEIIEKILDNRQTDEKIWDNRQTCLQSCFATKNISLKHLKLPKNHFKTNLFFVQLKHLKSTFTFGEK